MSSQKRDVPQTAIATHATALIEDNGAAPFTSDLLPPQQHVSPIFVVRTGVVWPTITPDGRLKGPPYIRLQWNFQPRQSGTIVGFRREGGFGVDGDRGELIIQSKSDGYKIEQLDPGEYFYSFFILIDWFDLGLVESYENKVQFSQTMPCPEKVLDVMRQAIEFTKLQRQFEALTDIAPKATPEDSETRFHRELSDAIASVDKRTEVIKSFRDRWESAKKQIRDGSEPDDTKKMRLEILNGEMKKIREKFQL